MEFVGNKPDWMDDMVTEHGLEENVFFHGKVTHQESLRIQQGFDMFLATSEKTIGGEHYCLPSKLFEYIGQNKPIVGIVTNGIQREFIEKSGLGVICDPDTAEESAHQLIQLITKGRNFIPDINYLKDFHRPVLAKKLASLLLSVAGHVHTTRSKD